MAKLNVDRSFISALIQSGELSTVKDKQIRNSFLGAETRRIYKFCCSFYESHGKMPSERVLSRNFGDYEFEKVVDEELDDYVIGTEEPLTYWCDELRNKVRHNKLGEMAENVIDKLNDKDLDGAMSELKKAMVTIEGDVEETSAIDTTQTGEDRIARYQKRRDCQGLIGIPTGIKGLDFMLKGLQGKQLITLIASTGVGKANPVDTPILTPNGFKLMRDIKVGDYVISRFGKKEKVVGIYPQGMKDVYQITFKDGTTTRCCKEHLWVYKTTDDVSSGNSWRIDTLENIMSKHPIIRGKKYNLCIPVCEPVEFSAKDSLPLDPYVMGVLLGDGGFTTDRVSLTTCELDILTKCNNALKEWGAFTSTCDSNYQYNFKSADIRENKLYRIIKSLGLIHHKSVDKFIPKIYLYSNVEDRRNLLKGLMDTDGSVSLSGSYSFSTHSKSLANDFMFLCRSLGYRCNRKQYGKEIRIIILTHDVIISSKKHKTRLLRCPEHRHKEHREFLSIISVDKLEEQEECQCIMVDSDDHTYLCDDFIVTHNTWLECIIGAYMQRSSYKVLHFTTEMSEEQIIDRYDALQVGFYYGGFNYTRFTDGKLTPEEEKNYFDYLQNKSPKLEPLIVDTAEGVSGVSAKIDLYEPDIVLIDGAYLMIDDMGAKDDWLRVTNIWRGLKRIAKSKDIPIFVNTQTDSTTSKKTGAGLENIGFSKAIGHDSDIVLTLFRDEQMIEDREAKIKLLKHREGSLGSLMMAWDFKEMNFQEIYSEYDKSDVEEVEKSDKIEKSGKKNGLKKKKNKGIELE